MASLRSTAVGYLALPGTCDDRSRRVRRAALHSCAEVEGLELAQVYEPALAGPGKANDPLATLEALASSCQARTVVTVGALDAPMMEMFRRAELRVITVPDPARCCRHREIRAAAQIEPGHSPEQVEIERINQWGHVLASVHVTIEATTVTLNIIDWTVVVLDRATFRAWLQQPDHVLTVDHVQWSRTDDHFHLRIDGSCLYTLSAITVARLYNLV